MTHAEQILIEALKEIRDFYQTVDEESDEDVAYAVSDIAEDAIAAYEYEIISTAIRSMM